MPSKLEFIRSQPVKRFIKGETLLQQGKEPPALFAVRKGFIKAYDLASDGSEQLVWLSKKGDILPLEWLFAQDKRSPYFYAAFTDVEVYVIDKGKFLDYLRENDKALLAMIIAISDKYRHIMSHLKAAQKPRARDKVLHLLSFIAARFSNRKSPSVEHVEVPFTHQDLANLVGLARETTTLELKKLKEQGVVDYEKNNFYINTKRLHDAIK